MEVYTIIQGRVDRGVKIQRFKIQQEIEIPAVLIGEEGRGRQLAVMPVQLLPEIYTLWKQGEDVCVLHADIGTTRSGRPRLIQIPTSSPDDSDILAVFYTTIGFRGFNVHTGDQVRIYCKNCGNSDIGFCDWQVCPQCGSGAIGYEYESFPGSILLTGIIAQGDAGRMGSGEQIIARLPKNKVFRVGLGGRLYGAPSEYFYCWGDGQLFCLTREQRLVADMF